MNDNEKDLQKKALTYLKEATAAAKEGNWHMAQAYSAIATNLLAALGAEARPKTLLEVFNQTGTSTGRIDASLPNRSQVEAPPNGLHEG